jgi:hypothetical protein
VICIFREIQKTCVLKVVTKLLQHSKYTVKNCLSTRHAARQHLCAVVCVDVTRLRVIENKNMRVDLSKTTTKKTKSRGWYL